MKYGNAVTVGAWLLVGTLLSTGPVAAQTGGDRCRFGDEFSTEFAASASERLAVVAGSGSLVVEGRAGASGVTVTALACASEEWMLEEMDVTLERRGSTLYLDTSYPNNSGRFGGYARIDLRVEVPLRMDAEIDDGSGSVTLSGLGALTVDDGSGELHVEDIQGAVYIDDGSGGIYVDDIRGSLDIDDGSGELEIRNVQGDVFVDDGSGSMEIIGVTGSVTVEDGSGSIEIRDVGQDVMAYEIGSGTIRVSNVEGNFTVRNGRNERIRYSRVRGVTDIPAPRRRR